MSTLRAPNDDESLDAVFSALADPTRRYIVATLARSPLPVGELAAPIDMSLAAVSKHLDVLERAGLVERVQEGRIRRCHFTPGPLDAASRFVQHYRQHWESALDRLAAFVEEPAEAAPPMKSSHPARTGSRRGRKR